MFEMLKYYGFRCSYFILPFMQHPVIKYSLKIKTLSKYVSQCVQYFIMLIVFAGEDHSTTLPVGDEMWHIVSYISVPKARRTLPLLPPEVNTTLILLVYQNIKTVEQYRNDFVTMAFDILYFQE